MRRFLIPAGMLVFLFSGCSCMQCSTSQAKTIPKSNPAGNCVISNSPTMQGIQGCILNVEAVGVGVAPASGMQSAAQAMAMARRAAILEGYRALVEKLYGIKINGRETLKNMMMQNESLRAYVQGVIRGANIIQESYKNGMYKVVMSLKINVNEWNRYLASNFNNM